MRSGCPNVSPGDDEVFLPCATGYNNSGRRTWISTCNQGDIFDFDDHKVQILKRLNGIPPVPDKRLEDVRKSSIDDLLIARHDPEEILLNLGFGGSPENDVLDRIPSRFLQQQSQAKGISTNQFLCQMDELERGCGFSLVGGLRSLGSALRRSSKMSTSPMNSRGPTPNDFDKSTKVLSDPPKKDLHTVLPKDMNHSLETTLVRSEVNGDSGHRVKCHNNLTEQSHMNDVLATLEEEPQSCQERLQSEELAAKVSSNSPLLSEAHRKDHINTHKHKVKDNTDTHKQGTSRKSQSAISKEDQSIGRDIEVESNMKCRTERVVSEERGPALQSRIVQLSSSHHHGATNTRGLPTRDDSFEFEELSSEERVEDAIGGIHAGEPAFHAQGNLSRSDSTQSDSSGFADEQVGCSELESPKSSSDVNTTISSDSKITQTSFDADTMERLESGSFQRLHSGVITTSDMTANLTMSQESSLGLPSVTSLEDSPFDDTVVSNLPNSSPQRTRCLTYPRIQDRREEESGPKTVIEILSSLHTTSRELEKEKTEEAAIGPARRRPRKLIKMKSVDPEGYGIKRNAESRGVQTQLEEELRRSCNVLHEVDEDEERVVSDVKVVNKAKDDTLDCVHNDTCQQVVHEYHAASEKPVEEVCEGPATKHNPSKVIPVCTNQESIEHLLPEPSHIAQSTSESIGHCSGSDEQCMKEVNLAIPLSFHPNDMQLSSQVENSCKSSEIKSNQSLSENLSVFMNNNICSNEHSDGADVVDSVTKEGLSIEQMVLEMNQTELSSQTSSPASDAKCPWDKTLPFRAYSSHEFEVEENEFGTEINSHEKFESKLDHTLLDEKEQLLVTAKTVETSSRNTIDSDGVSDSVDDISCNASAPEETLLSNTTQDAKSSIDTALPIKSLEPPMVMSEAAPPCSTPLLVPNHFAAPNTSPNIAISHLPCTNETHGDRDATRSCMVQESPEKLGLSQPSPTQEDEFLEGLNRLTSQCPEVQDSSGRFGVIPHVLNHSQDFKSLMKPYNSNTHSCETQGSPERPEFMLANPPQNNDSHEEPSNDSSKLHHSPVRPKQPSSEQSNEVHGSHVLSATDCAESCGKQDNPAANSSECRQDAGDVLKTAESLVLESALNEDSALGTRIEVISKEDHCKAREELKTLLSAQAYPSRVPSSPLKSVNHDEAVEDLKLLQRALVRYDQDLEELESWSSKLYKEVGSALNHEERSDLQSLSSVRHQIKDEIQSLEKNLMEKFQEVVSMDGADETEEESLWSPSLTQVMCQMVDLLKEQTSLRRFLDDLHALEYSTPPPPHPTWSQGAMASPKHRILFALANHGGSVDEVIDDDDPSEGESDLADEVANLGELPFPHVMTQQELIEELRKAQSDLKKMRIQSKHDVALAVREVRQSILSEVRREIQMESQLLQVQMQAKDLEIHNLRSMVRELKETSVPMSKVETSFKDWSRDKES